MSNLPPGVSVSMIPGNRPEDDEAEAFIDLMDTKVAEAGLNLPENWIEGDVWKLAEIAYMAGLDRGFNEGRAEGQLDVYAKWQEADERRLAEQSPDRKDTP